MEAKSISIFNKVMGLFLQNGIKSMTMDDIASSLGISKKTLYKHVSDKSDLVVKVIEEGRKEDECVVDEISKSENNSIDENFEITRYVTKKLNHMHPSIFYDIQKYYPKAWSLWMEHKENYIGNWIENNLRKGIEQGFYREDLNVEIIRDIYLARMDDMFDQKYPSMKQYSFSKVYLESFRYHIRGIASEKGIEYLVEKIKKEKSNHQ